MKHIKYCTTLNEYVAKNHPDKLAQLRLWYWLKYYSTKQGLKKGKIYVDGISLYKTQTGLRGILVNSEFWSYRHVRYKRENERFVILSSLNTVLKRFEITKEVCPRLYFRTDYCAHLKSMGKFNAFISKSVAELPLYKKSKNQIVGRSIEKISQRTGFTERTVIRHLKKSRLKRKRQEVYIQNNEGEYPTYKSVREAMRVDNITNLKNYIENAGKIRLEKQNNDTFKFKIRKPNLYLFTGIEQFSKKNPV